jgi:CMP-N-acetylneuraminic acid synthetase/GT2 family glycosyltransferase
MSKLCSIIIRTKNEERWISSCLSSVFNQSYDNFEVIIVDNESDDRSLEKAKQFPIKKIVTIKEYLPGDSLNIGIKASSGDYIVCLSGHCIPVDEYWLESLVNALEEDELYAGVYGRQEPMAFSTPADKRDLLLVFGLDKRIQQKDSFFHNANSILRRSLWEEVPFDPEVTNIEDRIWGQEMLNRGYKLVYEPKGSVYHYHGIHQDGNVERCNNVVRIIEGMQGKAHVRGRLDANQLEIIAILPVKGKDWLIGDRPQMAYTIEAAKASKYITRVFVTTDDRETAEMAESFGAECPFIRSESLTKDYIGLETVFRDAMERLEQSGVYPDLVVSLEETFPFRTAELVDDIIDHTLDEGFDSVLAAKRESGSLWQEDGEGSFDRLDSGDAPRLYKEKSYVGLKGLCCVTHPEFIRQERMLGNKVGLYEIDYPLAILEVRDEKGRRIAEQLLATDR